MRLILVLTLIAFPAFAAEKPKSIPLKPNEIADGWIMLFDGETAYGWKTEGEVKVENGTLKIGGKQDSSIETTTTFGPSTLRCLAAGSGEITVSMQGAQSDYSRTTEDGWRPTTFNIDSEKDAFSFRRVEFLNERESKTTRDRLKGPGVPSTIKFSVKAGGHLHLESIALKPQKADSIFNGKDLTGWKTYDPAKAKIADPKLKEVKVASKYSVTKEGWLNVKDGGGDLQTEGQWADFVVQFECISNGKHLNSGMFFRCIPDLYQQGYEAQIRNEWMGDDRTKPVDFGTGAIYRRQPTRKVVSTDGEWFTMTVAAHGRHIATWVNGYQTVDWTDDRKDAENARQGFKKSKGALSIQGHDPTTDLSFRNLRIQSLDGK